MAEPASRYAAPHRFSAGEGWRVERLTPPRRLFGANGLRTGPDGRIYVAQVPGSQVSAIDPDSGAITTISPMGGAIVAPDDLVFDEAGNMYLTEITEGRVTMLAPDGTTRVIREDVPMANAFEVGPDGMLYFPVMGTNQIWRVNLAGGAPEVVAGDLGVPDSVKFDSKGRIVSTQVASGQVLRIDPASDAREVLAQLEPGLDNCTFVGERLFVSSIPDEVTEILGGGQVRSLIPRGLQWPLGLAVELASGAVEMLAENLPVGAPAGVRPKPLGPIGDKAGPMIPFAGVAAGADGSLTWREMPRAACWCCARSANRPIAPRRCSPRRPAPGPAWQRGLRAARRRCRARRARGWVRRHRPLGLSTPARPAW